MSDKRNGQRDTRNNKTILFIKLEKIRNVNERNLTNFVNNNS